MAHFDRLLAYARRRTLQLSDAEDVVAEAFVVVWRRLDDVPADEDEHLPWLYGVARRVLANQRRGTQRRLRLLERLRSIGSPSGVAPAGLGDALDALARLPELDQEVLRLTAWEGLTQGEIAAALEISQNAVGIRLHRARRRLQDELKGSTASRTLPGWKGSARSARSGKETP